MAGKVFEVLFKIRGALDGSFGAAMKAAQSGMSALANAAKGSGGSLTKALAAAQQQAAAFAQASKLAGTVNATGFDKLTQSLARLQQMSANVDKLQQLRANLSEMQQAAPRAWQQVARAQLPYENQSRLVEQLTARLAALTAARDQQAKDVALAKTAWQSLRDDRARLKVDLDKLATKISEREKKGAPAEDLKTRQADLRKLHADSKVWLETARGNWKGAEASLAKMKADASAVKSELAAASSKLAPLRDTFSKAFTAAKELGTSRAATSAEIPKVNAQLKASGFDTSRFAASEQAMRAEIAATAKAIEQQIALQQRMATFAKAYEAAQPRIREMAKAAAAVDLKTQRVKVRDQVLGLIESEKGKMARGALLSSATAFTSGKISAERLQQQAAAVQKVQLQLARQAALINRQSQIKLPTVKPIDTKDAQTRLSESLDRIKEYQDVLKVQARTRREALAAHEAVVKLGTAYKQQQQAAANLKTQLEQLKSVHREQSQNLSQAQVQNLSRQIQQLTSAYERAQSSIKAAGANLSTAKSQWSSMDSAFRSQSAAARQLSEVLRGAGVSVDSLAAAEARLRSELDATNASMQRQSNFDAASSRFSDAYNDFQNVLSTAQTAMSPFTSSIEVAGDFERQMSVVKALTQMDNLRAGNLERTEHEMELLNAQAKELGLMTKFTAVDAAKAQTYYAYAGWNTDQILAATPATLNIATAAGMNDLGRIADGVSDIMSAFKIPAEQAGHTMDVLAYTFTHSNQDFEQLREAMKYAAPVARLFGSSLEETAAATKFMADAGIKGSMAGTSLRQTMLRIVAPPKTATKAMEQAGINLDDASKEWLMANEIAKEYGVELKEGLGVGKQMASVIRQINENMGDATNHEKMGVFKAITGIYAISGAANLFETGGELVDDPNNPGQKITRLEKFTYELEHSDGSTELVADIMADNYLGDVVKLNSAIENLQTNIGSSLTPVLRPLVQNVTTAVAEFSQWTAQHQNLVRAAAATVTALSTVAVSAAGARVAFAGWDFLKASIDMLKTRVAGLAPAFMTAARAAMGLALTPLGATLAALGVAAYVLYQNWDKVAPVLEGVASTFKASVEPALKSASFAVEVLMKTLEPVGEALSRALGSARPDAVETIIRAFILLASVVADVCAAVITAVAGMGKVLAAVFADISRGIGALVKGEFTEAAVFFEKAMKDLATGSIDAVVDAGKQLANIPEHAQQALDNYDKVKQQREVEEYRETVRGQYEERLRAKGIDPEEQRARIREDQAKRFALYRAQDAGYDSVEAYEAALKADKDAADEIRRQRYEAVQRQIEEDNAAVGIATKYDEDGTALPWDVLTDNRKFASKEAATRHALPVEVIRAAAKAPQLPTPVQKAAADSPQTPTPPPVEVPQSVAEFSKLDERAKELAQQEVSSAKTLKAAETTPVAIRAAAAQAPAAYTPGAATGVDFKKAPTRDWEVETRAAESRRIEEKAVRESAFKAATTPPPAAYAPGAQASLDTSKFQTALEKSTQAQTQSTSVLESLRNTFAPPVEKVAPKAEKSAPAPQPTPQSQLPSYQIPAQATPQFSIEEMIRQANEAARIRQESQPQPPSNQFNLLEKLDGLIFQKAAASEAPQQQFDTSLIQSQLTALGTQVDANAQNFAQINSQTQGTNQSLAEILNSTEAFGQHLQSMADSSSTANESLSTVTNAAETAQQSLTAVTENATAIQTANETFSQVTQAISESVSTAITALTESLSTASTAIAETFATISTSLAEAFTAIFTSAAPVTESFAQVNSQSLQMATNFSANNAAVLQDSAAFTSNTSAVQQNATTALASASSLMTFSGAVQVSAGSVAVLGSSSASAAGSISALGSAAASAVATMNSAAASIASAAANVGSPAQNYSGGIYHKGAFLTWFAEKSPEAAIPLDGSDRAISLWAQAGNMLGVYPYEGGDSPAGFDAPPILKPAENYRGGIYAPGGKSLTSSSASQYRILNRRSAVIQSLVNSGVPATTVPFAEENKKRLEELTGTQVVAIEKQTEATQQTTRELQKVSEHIGTYSKATESVSAETRAAATSISNATQDVSATEKTTKRRKNFIEKGAEAVNDFFFGIFHPRKARDKKRGYSTDKLGNIIGLDGLQDNVITGDETIAVQRAKREAQLREFEEKKKRGDQPKIVDDKAAVYVAPPIPKQLPTAPAPPPQQQKIPPLPNLDEWTVHFAPEQSSKPNILEQIFTPPSVKNQRAAQAALDTARNRNLDSDVKASKSYQVLTSARREATGAMMEPRQYDGRGLIEHLSRGNWKGAIDVAGQMYERRNEIKAKDSIVNPISNENTPSTAVLGATHIVSPEQTKRPKSPSALAKVGKSVHDFFFKLLHPRKATAKELGYEQDKLGNIKNLGGNPDNIITENDTKAVRNAKWKAQVHEMIEKRRRQTDDDVGTASTDKKETRRKNTFEKIFEAAGSIGKGKRNAFLDWNPREDLTGNLGRVVYNMFGGDQTGVHPTGGGLLGGIGFPMAKNIVSTQTGSKVTLGGILEEIYTPQSVKSQRAAQSALDTARSRNLSDNVKASKSYQALTAARKPSNTPAAMMAPQQYDGRGVIEHLSRGNWKGALDVLGTMYSRKIEIGDYRNPQGAPHTTTFPVPTKSQPPLPPIVHQNSASSISSPLTNAPTNFLKTYTHATNAPAAQNNSLAQVQNLTSSNSEGTFNSLSSDSRSVSTSSDSMSMPPINLNFTITIQGNADRNEVEAGVRQAIPPIRESFEDQWRRFAHENQRRGFTW